MKIVANAAVSSVKELLQLSAEYGFALDESVVLCDGPFRCRKIKDCVTGPVLRNRSINLSADHGNRPDSPCGPDFVSSLLFRGNQVSARDRGNVCKLRVLG